MRRDYRARFWCVERKPTQIDRASRLRLPATAAWRLAIDAAPPWTR
jgi:hypothetical protein